MQIVHLFPKAVGVFNLNRKLTKKELINININLDSLEKNELNSISKNKFVLDNPDLSKLKQFINESIKKYLSEVLEENTDLKITQSWLNKTLNGEGHHIHCHPNSYLSGVFYVQTNDDDKITFYKNDPRDHYYKPSVNNWNLVNSKSWWLPTPQNSLIIFRSDLHHSVPQTVNHERISLSFNTFPADDLGDEQSATYLPLSNYVAYTA